MFNDFKMVVQRQFKSVTDDLSFQLSSLRFSSTQRNELLYKVSGKFSRTFKITF